MELLKAIKELKERIEVLESRVYKNNPKDVEGNDDDKRDVNGLLEEPEFNICGPPELVKKYFSFWKKS